MQHQQQFQEKETILYENYRRPVPETRKLIHRHLKDPNDIIRDEDIRDIQVGKINFRELNTKIDKA